MKKLSTDLKSELVILQEKEHRIQQEIDAIESRLISLKRVSSLLCLIEKCGAYIQDPNHNSILGLEDELRADKTELNKVKERIKQTKNAPTNASVTSSNSQNIQNSSSSFTLTEKIIAIAVLIIVCFLVLDNSSGFYESDYDSATEKYGFVNIFNRVKIPYEYEGVARDNGRIDVFSADKICWVKKDGLWGAINKKNKVIVPFEYESESNFLKTDELSELTKNGKHGLITEDGEILIPFEYDEAFYFDENNITLAIKDGKVGAINTENEIIIPFEYEAITNNPAYSFKLNKVIFLEKNNKIGAIDNKGEIVISFEYELAYETTTIDGEPYTHYYTQPKDFYNYGVIILKKNNKCGVLDANNNTIISFEYDYICMLYNSDVDHNYFWAHKDKDGTSCYFDLEGNLIQGNN